MTISRIFKLAFGAALLLITLNQDYLDTQNLSVLSLFAVPIIFAGLYDWRPLEYLSYKLMDKIAAFADALHTKHTSV